jgi:uridine kinase
LLGDHIQIKQDYFATAVALCDLLRANTAWQDRRIIIGIAGESGSGKSVTAVCLQKVLADFGRNALIIHQDDFFKLPPASNHQARLNDLQWIGPQEVHLDQIGQAIDDFLAYKPSIEMPLVHYQANEILSETVQLTPYDMLIIEGTYVLQLDKIGVAIYMDRTFEETKIQRLERGRELQSSFIEEVLAIEHQLIRPQKQRANYIVDKQYQVILKQGT